MKAHVVCSEMSKLLLNVVVHEQGLPELRSFLLSSPFLTHALHFKEGVFNIGHILQLSIGEQKGLVTWVCGLCCLWKKFLLAQKSSVADSYNFDT